MEVRMKPQLLVPGVQHHGEPADRGLQSLGRGQLLRQGAGGGLEEQIVGLPGKRTEEAGAQLGRQGEGDQEVGRLDELLALAPDPLGGGRPSALGAGLVIAGVPGEMNLPALRTGKGPPAQGRGPALGDGPEGAALVRREMGA